MASEKAIAFPKIDLHRHLDGDVKYNVAKTLADKEGIKMPAKNEKDWYGWLEELRDKGLANVFQEGFGFVTSLLQTEENLALAAYEEARNLKDDGIIYSEQRIAPEYHIGSNEYYGHKGKKKLTYPEIFGAVHEGFKAGENDFGVVTRLIPCINREAEPEKGLEIAKNIVACKRRYGFGIVGADIVCDEFNFPPERHYLAYDYFNQNEVDTTGHFGEFGKNNYRNMYIGLCRFKAKRGEHVREIAQYDDLVAHVVHHKQGLVMCPPSNLYCGFIESIKDLKIKDLLERQALVSVGSDDPGMFGFTLSDAIDLLVEEGGLTWGDIAQLQFNAIDTSFIYGQERQQIRNHLENELLQWGREYLTNQ